MEHLSAGNKTDLRPGIIKYIKKLIRMKRWALEHGDGQMTIECAEAIVTWKRRLIKLFREKGYDV